MNLRDLRYLVAVAEHRHFGKAAQACFVSQPTLSTQLRKLEETLGVTLIERGNRQIMLSPAGEQIVAQARKVLQEVNVLTTLADQYRDPLGGQLKLGVIPTLAPYVLPRILTPLKELFPNLSLNLTESQTVPLVQKLKEGELDVLLLALPLNEENIVEYELCKEPFLFAVPKSHAKADRKSVSVNDLSGESVLLLEDGHCLRDQALDVCHSHRAEEDTNFRATSIETLRQMVAAGVGTTLMPEMAVDTAHDDVVYLPFRNKPPHRNVGLCWRASSTRLPLLEELAPAVKRMLKS